MTIISWGITECFWWCGLMPVSCRFASGRSLFYFIPCLDFVCSRTLGGQAWSSAYSSCLLSARKDEGMLKPLSRLVSQLAAIQRAQLTRAAAGRIKKTLFFLITTTAVTAVHTAFKFGPQLFCRCYWSSASQRKWEGGHRTCVGLGEVCDLIVSPLGL